MENILITTLFLIPLRDVLILNVFNANLRLSEIFLILFDILFLLNIKKIRFKKNNFVIPLIFYMFSSLIYILIGFTLDTSYKKLIYRELINIIFYPISFYFIYLYFRLL